VKKYRFTAQFSGGKRPGQVKGTVEAHDEAGARQAIAECVQQEGASKNQTWTATNINLT
jgi:hypothetical protein